VFHLCLHPYIFALEPSLAPRLEAILAFVAARREQGRVEVITMRTLAERAGEEKAQGVITSTGVSGGG
jgi:hypothetical protein